MRLLVWFEWTAFAASALVLLPVAYGAGTILYVFGPQLIKPCMIAHGNFAKNGRGDLVEDQWRDCAIIGSEAVERIGLRLADTEDFVALVYYDQRQNSHEAGLRWIDDKNLSVDLGEVTWLTPQIDHLGPIKISYTYSGGELSLE